MTNKFKSIEIWKPCLNKQRLIIWGFRARQHLRSWEPEWMIMMAKWNSGTMGRKASWHLSYRWGITPKKLTQETCPDRGSKPGPLRDRRACYHLPHSGGCKKRKRKELQHRVWLKDIHASCFIQSIAHAICKWERETGKVQLFLNRLSIIIWNGYNTSNNFCGVEKKKRIILTRTYNKWREKQL